MTKFQVVPCGESPVVSFAAEELIRHFQMAGCSAFPGKWMPGKEQEPGVIRIGTVDDVDSDNPFEGLKDAQLDDAVRIRVSREGGILAGSNERSVLLAVYRFLYELGFRWVRPGKDGVCAPEKGWKEKIPLALEERASFRHRGICIEGAESVENILDLLDWMPKVGYNAYFVQFDDAYIFLNRWYTHENNPLLPPHPISRSEGTRMTEWIIEEAHRRGLMYHAVGHGWTTRVMGLCDGGWEKTQEPPPETRGLLAEMDGKRTLFHGVPTNTNLCYSSPEVVERFAETVAEYARQHPETDYLHVWLADAFNNQCECPACREHLPTDLYIHILNEIDRRLTERGVRTRIVMLAYQELLWAPEKERLHNPDRFVLMFAPISRSFEHSYAEPEPPAQVPAYERNHITMPVGIAENTAFLRGWQKAFSGDSFDYDYHLGRAHYGDPGYQRISEVLWEDVRSLPALGLNGMMLCQEQRVGFPTWMPNYTGGMTLWNRSTDFKELTRDYFSHCFGEGWEECLAYCELASRSFSMDFWNGKKVDREKVAARLESFLKEQKRYETSLPAWESAQEPVRSARRILHEHLRYARLFAQALLCRARGEEAATREHWRAFAAWIREHEMPLQPWLDVYRIMEIGQNYTGFSE